MVTNISWMDNVSDPGEVIEAVIESTGGNLIIAVMISLFFIIAISLKAKNKGMDEILIYSGALEFIIATFAVANQYIHFYWLMGAVALLFAGIMFRFFAQD